jgi:hypothetical protein
VREYKFYILDDDERIFIPALCEHASDDETAVKWAASLICNRAVEIWQGVRFVACLKPKTLTGLKTSASDQVRRTQASPDP